MKKYLLFLLLTFISIYCYGASPEESSYLFGLHDSGGEYLFEQSGKTGWIVFTEAIGANSKDHTGKDYSPWTKKGHGAIVRLNYGYNPQGTLPCAATYPQFIKRAVEFIKASSGAHIWIIGNEINLKLEWPSNCGTNEPEPISVANYAQLFKSIREQVHALDRHQNDQIVPAALSWTYQETTEHILDYQRALIEAIGENGFDGYAIHTYTQGNDSALVISDQKMRAPYSEQFSQFRGYRDRIGLLPSWARSLPIYITETRPRPWSEKK